MILLIDNFDSFTYNLYQLCLELGKEVEVRRNNAISVSEVAMMQPDAIILSPGPGRPEDSGVCAEVVKAFYEKIPILGVCLGHQLICQLFGGDGYTGKGNQAWKMLPNNPSIRRFIRGDCTKL